MYLTINTEQFTKLKITFNNLHMCCCECEQSAATNAVLTVEFNFALISREIYTTTPADLRVIQHHIQPDSRAAATLLTSMVLSQSALYTKQ